MTPDALTRLVRDHSPALTLFARQWCRSAEDVVQSAFVKLAGRRELPEHVLPWLYRVVRNGAIDAARAEHRRHKHENTAAQSACSWFEPSDDPNGIDDETVMQSLHRLPIEQREIIIAHLWGGLTFEQIAQSLDSSASTTYRRYHAGLEQLRITLRIENET